MKVLKKLELHDYSVLDFGEMKSIRGGTEKSEYVKCESYSTESRCASTEMSCLNQYNIPGTCKWIGNTDGSFAMCGCFSNQKP